MLPSNPATNVAPVLLPMLVAGLLVWQISSGRIFLYISDRTLWLLVLSVPLLIAMGLANLRFTPRTCNLPRGLLLLGLPLALAVLAPARPLASAAIETRGPAGQTSALWDPSAAPVLVTAVRTWDLKQLGLLRARDPDMLGLDGHHASLVGFVYHPRGVAAQPDEFVVGRFVVRCCTADAVATSLAVRYPDAVELAPDTWVEVQGTIQYATEPDRASPFVAAELVTVVPQPERPYLTLP